MKKTLSVYEFCREFETSDSRKDTFSHAGQKALYEYLCDYEESTGEEIEMDVVALCCDFSEYESALAAAVDYGYIPEQEEDEEEEEPLALAWLEEKTQVIPFDGRIPLSDGTVLGNAGVIIQQF